MLFELVILIVGIYAIYRFTQHPITLEVTVNAGSADVAAESEEAAEMELSSEVKEYIQQESDEWARAARTRRAKRLLAKLGDPVSVLRELKREDYV